MLATSAVSAARSVGCGSPVHCCLVGPTEKSSSASTIRRSRSAARTAAAGLSRCRPRAAAIRGQQVLQRGEQQRQRGPQFVADVLEELRLALSRSASACDPLPLRLVGVRVRERDPELPADDGEELLVLVVQRSVRIHAQHQCPDRLRPTAQVNGSTTAWSG